MWNKLTPREMETCWLLANEGLTDKQLAVRMGLSQLTAKQYVAHSLRKLGFETRAQLIVWIWQTGNIVQINDVRYVELARGDTTGDERYAI